MTRLQRGSELDSRRVARVRRIAKGVPGSWCCTVLVGRPHSRSKQVVRPARWWTDEHSRCCWCARRSNSGTSASIGHVAGRVIVVRTGRPLQHQTGSPLCGATGPLPGDGAARMSGGRCAGGTRAIVRRPGCAGQGRCGLQRRAGLVRRSPRRQAADCGKALELGRQSFVLARSGGGCRR
jgi:hypothetical protein